MATEQTAGQAMQDATQQRARHATLRGAIPADNVAGTQEHASSSAAQTPRRPASEQPGTQRPSKRRAPAFNRVIHTNWSLVVVCFVAVLVTIFSVSSGDFDNDMWWLLATGREIVENGIPATNPWSIHDGLQIVIQQWLAAVILYTVYAAFGLMGLKFLVVFQSLILAAVLFGLCRIVSGHRHGSGEVFAVAIAIGFVSLSAYISVRPHLYSMTLFSLVVAVMELYRLQHRRIWLALIPLLTLIHVNVHAAMAPFDLFIVALYLIPDFPALMRRGGFDVATRFFRMDYRRLPILVALIAGAIAMLVNPYGLNGALYLVLSYGAADYGNYINEMGTTGFWTDYGGAAMAMIVLGSIAIGHNGRRRMDIPLTVLFVVCIPLSMMHTRNVWLVALFAIPLFARSFGAICLNTDALKAFSDKLFNGLVALALVIAGTTYAAVNTWPDIVANAENDTSSLPSKAMDYLDAYVENHNIDKKSLKLYNSFNCGGYIEWRGYKVFMDPRPELWEPGITGVNRNYYKEFVDFAQDKASVSTFISEYNFDFLIAYVDSSLNTYLRTSSLYELACTGSGYQMYARKGILSSAETAANAEENHVSSANGATLAEDVRSLNAVNDAIRQ